MVEKTKPDAGENPGTEPLSNPGDGPENTLSDMISRENPSQGQARRLATGPRTPEGKRRASQNARKHGLTAKNCFPPNVAWAKLPAQYRQVYRRLLGSLQPESELERMTVEILTSAFYRWRAVAALQTLVLGRLKFDIPDEFEVPQEVREQIIREFLRCLTPKAQIAFLAGLPDPPGLVLPPGLEDEEELSPEPNPPSAPSEKISVDPALLVREMNRHLEVLGEICDRLQKYEAHYWRMFVHALRQLESLQENRHAQSVLAPLEVEALRE